MPSLRHHPLHSKLPHNPNTQLPIPHNLFLHRRQVIHTPITLRQLPVQELRFVRAEPDSCAAYKLGRVKGKFGKLEGGLVSKTSLHTTRV